MIALELPKELNRADKDTIILLLLNKGKRGSKRTIDLVTLSSCWKRVKKLIGSKQELMVRLGVSHSTVELYDKIDKLNEDLKKLIQARLLDNAETIEAISRLKSKEKQMEVAEAVIKYKLSTKDTRNLVKFVRSHENLTVKECVKRILKSRLVTERQYAIVLRLKKDIMQVLDREAKKSSSTVPSLIKSILSKISWLDGPLDCNFRGDILIIRVNETDYNVLTAKAESLNVGLDELIEYSIDELLPRETL